LFTAFFYAIKLRCEIMVLNQLQRLVTRHPDLDLNLRSDLPYQEPNLNISRDKKDTPDIASTICNSPPIPMSIESIAIGQTTHVPYQAHLVRGCECLNTSDRDLHDLEATYLGRWSPRTDS
jgi:hypothetical protein